MSTVRTRIAPSPTGPMHVGTARAALFNELYARKHSGTFIVRMEDTDQERSKIEYERDIMEGLDWIGLQWNEGPDIGGPNAPYRQSERVDAYRRAAQTLLEEEKAYRDGNAVLLSVEPHVVSFEDEVRGTVNVHTNDFEGDFVIARSIDDPLYHLAVVVDDAEMDITHVIRGEDHLHNTAKHILIQNALGYKRPNYAHLPLLLDEERKKLSKRSVETNLLAYRDMGYLPEAMLNYLALLGWNPGDDRELFTHEELIETFSLERVQKGGAIFSTHKLDAINKEYIRALSASDLFDATKPFLEAAGIDLHDRAFIEAALATEQERVARLDELPEAIRFAVERPAEYPAERLVWRKSTAEQTLKLLEQLIAHLTETDRDDFTQSYLEQHLLDWIDANDMGRGDTLWPMRVALTGREHSPGPFEVSALLGKDETLNRLQSAHAKLATYSNTS